jgi:hypothetical protein
MNSNPNLAIYKIIMQQIQVRINSGILSLFNSLKINNDHTASIYTTKTFDRIKYFVFITTAN